MYFCQQVHVRFGLVYKKYLKAYAYVTWIHVFHLEDNFFFTCNGNILSMLKVLHATINANKEPL